MLMTPSRSAGPAHRAEPYHAPTQIRSTRLRELLQSAQRVPEWDANKLNDFMSAGLDPAMTLFSAGDLALHNPCVSIVGKRDATAEGRARASRLARELVKQGVTIVSGLARGIDTAAHLSTLESGGRTAAVIGTPLSKASPVQNGPSKKRFGATIFFFRRSLRALWFTRRIFRSVTELWPSSPTQRSS